MYDYALSKNYLLKECVFSNSFRINFCNTIHGKASFSFIKSVNFFQVRFEWNRSLIYGHSRGLNNVNQVFAILCGSR